MTVEELIEKASRLTDAEIGRLRSAWFRADEAEGGEALEEVLKKAVPGEQDEIGDRVCVPAVPRNAWTTAYWAALALAFRSRISEEHFNTLYGPWASVMERA